MEVKTNTPALYWENGTILTSMPDKVLPHVRLINISKALGILKWKKCVVEAVRSTGGKCVLDVRFIENWNACLTISEHFILRVKDDSGVPTE